MGGRKSVIAAMLLVLTSGGLGATDSLRTLVPGILRVGTYFVNPPFEYVAKGADVGFEVDLMEEIARRLGLRAIFVNTPWETILQEMENGRRKQSALVAAVNEALAAMRRDGGMNQLKEKWGLP